MDKILKNILDWLKSIIIAMLIAAVIRWGTIENFTIPTSSMESSLLIGDMVGVSKLHYGPRLTMTPLQIPITHGNIWGTNIKSYLEYIKLPYFRFWGFSKIKRNDCVVFNNPIEKNKPIDLRTYFVKRCIGLPGEYIEIINKNIYINGKKIINKNKVQYKYFLQTNKYLSKDFFLKKNIFEYEYSENGYLINTYKENVDSLKTLNFIEEIIPIIKNKEDSNPMIYSFPENAWNEDNFGPLLVPKKGMKIILDENNVSIFGILIQKYENNTNIHIKNGIIYENDSPITSYIFKQNYYFMIGDNRDSSSDSRFWGFVPEDHILGKVVIIIMSFDRYGKNIFKKFRFNRFFKLLD